MLKNLLTTLLGRLGYVIKKRRGGIHRSSRAGKSAVAPRELMRAIHGKDIYTGFDPSDYPLDLAGWGSDSDVFEKLINEIQPGFIIEVGTWKGASAIRMADLMKQKCGGGVLLCIDTWLGAIEFWENHSDSERFLALECRHGYPQVYYRFLANVIQSNQQDVIVPFPIHSSSGALWLIKHDLKADLIYIDASHEEEDVYQDLLDYYQLLRKGGVLFGDDWCWRSVRAAVEQFAKCENRKIAVDGNKWVLRK